MDWLQIIIYYLLAVNVITFFAYGIDKYKAKHDKWRTSEATLLWLAVLGGSVGAWLGMRVWHHKTMHKKFKYGVPAILLLQIAAVVAVLCLTSCRCCKTTTEVRERPTLLGGYTNDRPLTKEEKALFDKAYKGEVALRPVSVATQVVAGINYSFVCEDKDGNKYKVVIYQPLPGQGEARVTSIKKETV